VYKDNKNISNTQIKIKVQGLQNKNRHHKDVYLVYIY